MSRRLPVIRHRSLGWCCVDQTMIPGCAMLGRTYSPTPGLAYATWFDRIGARLSPIGQRAWQIVLMDRARFVIEKRVHGR